MSSQWTDYQNLFGSDDEDDAAPLSAPPPAPGPASLESESEDEDDEPPKDDDDNDEDFRDDDNDEDYEERPKKILKKKKPQKESSGDKGAAKKSKKREGHDEAKRSKPKKRPAEPLQDSEGEYEEAPAEGKKRRGEGKEKTAVEMALQALKKKRKQKLEDDEADRMCQDVVQIMTSAYEEDKKALMEGRPATHKLRQLDKVMSSLRNKQLQHHLVDKYKLLALIAQWLKPLPDKSLPLYAVRTPLIQLLLELHVEISQLKQAEIGRVVQQLSKHHDETTENKTRLGEIIETWSRLLTGKNSNRHIRPEEGEERSRLGGRADDYYVATTARGVAIPIRTGFNFAIMPAGKYSGNDDDEDDRGMGHEDQAMEVQEREPREGESKVSRVKRAMKLLGRGKRGR